MSTAARAVAEPKRQDPLLGQLLHPDRGRDRLLRPRREILEDWGNQFGFTQTELGTITGGGLIGFGLAIIFFSFFADRFGYGKLMLVAFLLHASSAVVTFAATPVFNAVREGRRAFWCLNIGHVALRPRQRDVRGGHQPADRDPVPAEQDALAEHPARRLAAAG